MALRLPGILRNNTLLFTSTTEALIGFEIECLLASLIPVRQRLHNLTELRTGFHSQGLRLCNGAA